MTSQPQTLFDIAGVQARIFTLPNRPPFMIAADVAEVYGTSVKALNQAVSRNPEYFPEDFSFYLTPAEEQVLWSQIVTTSLKKRDDFQTRAFTHAGANGTSAVLKTATAAKAHVAIHRAFAEMEAAALASADAMILRLRTEEAKRKPIRVQVMMGANGGLSFDAICKMGGYARWRVAEALRDCLKLGLIDRLPAGMPMVQSNLFGGV